MKYCAHCGAQLVDEAVVCPKCGCAVAPTKTVDPNASPKSRLIALLLCTAAYLNWNYVEPPADLLQTDGSSADSASAASDDGAAAGEDYFASSRLTREKARDEAVSTLKELSESADADETAKEDAASQISALAAASVQEANIESLIRAKGYADAVVMLSDGSANIVVSPPEGGLQADDVTKIRDIVVSETGMSAGQIKIVEAGS